MQYKDIDELIAGGESTTVEFKRKISKPKKIAKELVAFANTKGGHLIVGIDDNGTVYGIDSEKYEVESIEFCCNHLISPAIEPNIQIMSIKGKYIVICYIAPSEQKPHYLLDDEENTKQAYVRVGEKSVPASKEMTKILHALNPSSKPVTIYIGDMEKRFFAYLEKYERGTVNDFSKLVNISKRRAHRMIVNLVRAGVLAIHCSASGDYYTLV